ncbi:DciA family protein [Streptomyces sp. NPDC055709]
MTDTAPAGPQASGPPDLSGVDLARVALHQAREDAKKLGRQARAPRRRPLSAVRRDGRDPAECAVIFQGLMTERAWELPAVGGTVLDHWPDIASAVSPQLAAHAAAVAFHLESGQLDLRPDSPAYATQLRLISARIITAANDHVGAGAVRTVRVLPVGALPRLGPRRLTSPRRRPRSRLRCRPGSRHRRAITQRSPRTAPSPCPLSASTRPSRGPSSGRLAPCALSQRVFPDLEAAPSRSASRTTPQPGRLADAQTPASAEIAEEATQWG